MRTRRCARAGLGGRGGPLLARRGGVFVVVVCVILVCVLLFVGERSVVVVVGVVDCVIGWA